MESSPSITPNTILAQTTLPTTTQKQEAIITEEVPTETQEQEVNATGQEVMQPQSPGAVQHFLFKCLVNVKAEEQDVAVEIHWVEGQNKDLMNQLCTYLKNTLFRVVAKPLGT
jgi:methyltransferase